MDSNAHAIDRVTAAVRKSSGRAKVQITWNCNGHASVIGGAEKVVMCDFSHLMRALLVNQVRLSLVDAVASGAGSLNMKASRIAFPSAVLLVIAGMIWGIVMAASRDHSTMPAHAHLNLLGWVSLFLFGIFYQLHPALDASRAALAQVAIWIVGTVVLVLGVGLLSKGSPIGEPLATAGSIAVLLDMALFGWLVLRSGFRRSVLPSAMPAE
jgi:hypothetical protein